MASAVAQSTLFYSQSRKVFTEVGCCSLLHSKSTKLVKQKYQREKASLSATLYDAMEVESIYFNLSKDADDKKPQAKMHKDKSK